MNSIMKTKSLISLFLVSVCFAQGKEAVSLFNGKDLAGWKNANYVVEDGVLVCKGGNLVTEKQYTNYIFEFDFLLPPGGNNGLGIHYPGSGDAAYSGMELQILDNSHPRYAKLKDYQFHGSLYTLQAAKRGHLKPVGEWNHEKVTVDGPLVKVELNGVVILDANLDELNKQKPKHKGATAPERASLLLRARGAGQVQEHHDQGTACQVALSV